MASDPTQFNYTIQTGVSIMKLVHRICSAGLLVLALNSSIALAESNSQSPEGLQVLKSMSEFIGRQSIYRISGQSSSDAWLEAGLVVSNTAEIQLDYRQPASMHFTSTDGTGTDVLNINHGKLLYLDDSTGYYAIAETPNGVHQALDFAFDELGIDLPLMDLVRGDAFDRMVNEGDSVLYLTDSALVAGVKCHQVVIRSPELDIQLWVQNGDQPLPRRVILTDKWSQGSPRFVANMQWNLSPDFDRDTFDYSPPEGAEKIEFVRATEE